VESDNPKDEARNKKRLKLSREVGMPYIEKKQKEGIKLKVSGWADNTGHMIGWWEFETMDDFAKIWNDEEFQQIMARRTYLVDNASFRLLRPSIWLAEEK